MTAQMTAELLDDLAQTFRIFFDDSVCLLYLYHLDAMEDPCHRNYPADLKDALGPRHMLHSYATNVDDATVQPRWGKIGKQKIDDDGELCPKRMETVDDEILANTFKFPDKARADRKPFFLWLNPTRMHVITHLSDKCENMRNSENGWSIQEAGMAQLDDIVGSVMKYLKDNGLDENTIIGFTTDNGTENFSWPDGGQTPFAGGKGTVMEGGFRAPMILRWPGKVPAGKTENGVVSGLDWFPTLAAAAGYQGDIAVDLRKGKQLGDSTYKVHLDGYNQMDLITGKGKSARREVFYFAESTLGAVRIGDYKYRFIDQPGGWLGGTVKLLITAQAAIICEVSGQTICRWNEDAARRGEPLGVKQATWFIGTARLLDYVEKYQGGLPARVKAQNRLKEYWPIWSKAAGAVPGMKEHELS